MGVTYLVLVIALAGVAEQAQGTPAEPQAETRVCGEVIARRTTAACDTILRVASAGEEFVVVVPASVRKDVSAPLDRLRGGQACFTGVPTTVWVTARLAVSSAKGVEILALPPGVSATEHATAACGAMTMPQVLSDQKPHYSSTAMRSGVQGTVEVEAVVDAGGFITDARVVRPLDAELDQAALDAVRQWKFVPGTVNGKPASVVVDIEMSFTLNPKRR